MMLVLLVESIPIQQALKVTFVGMEFCFAQSYKFFSPTTYLSILNKIDAFESPKGTKHNNFWYHQAKDKALLCFLNSLLLQTFELNHSNFLIIYFKL